MDRVAPSLFRHQPERPLSTEPINDDEDLIPCELRAFEHDIIESAPPVTAQSLPALDHPSHGDSSFPLLRNHMTFLWIPHTAAWVPVTNSRGGFLQILRTTGAYAGGREDGADGSRCIMGSFGTFIPAWLSQTSSTMWLNTFKSLVGGFGSLACRSLTNNVPEIQHVGELGRC